MSRSGELWMAELEQIIEMYAFDEPEECVKRLVAHGLNLDEAQAEVAAANGEEP